jgi:hypothetical protein
MALGMRNSLLQLFFYLAFIFLLFLILIAFLHFSKQLALETNRSSVTQIFWFVYDNNPDSFFWNQVGILLLYLIPFIAFFRFKILFKKTGSSELFFLEIFLFSLLFEVFRCGNFLVDYFNWPVDLNLFFIRIVYFGRFFGLFALFFSSLYTLQMDYQKYNIVIGIIALVSFALSLTVSLETVIPLTNGLFKLSDERGLFILMNALKIFTIMNFIIAAFKRDVFLLLLAVSFLLTGRELLIFAPAMVFLILGGSLLLGGTILINIKIRDIYYWI